ncbi:tetratricopeptide repeat protein [Oryzomonas rubra]|uniref:Tetratricopeptide repeat protein n=1 Tax=Oryzomonas rubra TaxID=2509454 RepID=A0A5A9XBP2_9BACT|nr:tetratricopeptide repeat protein [Oryzomonas rubra]
MIRPGIPPCTCSGRNVRGIGAERSSGSRMPWSHWYVNEQTEQGHMDIESCYQLGALLKEQGDILGAERCFRRIVEQAPDLPDPQHSLGVVLQLQERLVEAIGHYRAAIALDPCFVKAHYNLATALWRSGSYQEAMACARKTIDLDPAHAEAHGLLGQLALLTGDLGHGWDEYEWRWETREGSTKKQDLGRPQWDGSPLAGRTLLIHMEQGRGDMIQFIRYAPLAAATGGRVVVCALRELVALLATVEGISQVVDRQGPLPEFDVHIPVLSLPRVLGTTLETVPNRIPYLRPDPAKVAAWRQLMPANGRVRVGLVWAGQEKPDPFRSMPLSACVPLLSLPHVDIYSLQMGRGVEEITSLAAGGAIIDHTARISDFADTAALIANLDLVITIDTAVAHLAGALGKQAWILLPFVPDWRWLLARDDSPWYPTMRLFRQQSPGDWHGVVERVREALEQRLGSPAFHNQRGIELLQAGQPGAAEQAFSAAIAFAPDYAEAHSNLGATLDNQKRYREALASYRTALSLKPDFVQALFNMGNVHRELGELAEARRCYEQVRELSPGLPQADLCLAQIWKEERDFARARGCVERVLALRPDDASALHSLGEICQAEERFPEAIEAYQRALAIEPGNVKSQNMLGMVFHLIGSLEAAEECYRKALAAKPDALTVLNNLGAVYQSQGRFSESVAVLRQAVAVDPSYAEAHWNLALSLLARGEYRDGWLEYEWRFKKSNPVPERHFDQPRWDGSPLDGRTILLHCEQGFGDTLQFIRYAPLVAQRGGRVVVECQTPALKRLIAGVAGVSDVIAAGEALPSMDCHAHLLSLPLIFQTTVATIPADVPYLRADPADRAIWRGRMGSAESLKVGLVWSGRQNLVLNRKRTCNLSIFAPLAAVPNVIFYSLQVGDGAEQATEAPVGLHLVDLTAHIRDFADTAALIANLDLVITIDTSVAHLAGAMAKPTWVLLPHVADWRWLANREDSPWYPGTRLFRQSVPGDWQGVVRSVASALEQYRSAASPVAPGPVFLNASSPGEANAGVPVTCPPPPGLAKRPRGLKVGLAWSGRQNKVLNRKRSCPLAAFTPLADVPNVTFYSLQVGSGVDRATEPPPGMAFLDLTGHIHDFEDTAAFIANLDLIITIDTSVAHLAGAMGKPAWVLLPYAADWRWLTTGGDSPWYPGVRLFRQPDLGEWDAVIQAVAEALNERASSGWGECPPQPRCPGPARFSEERAWLERSLDGYLRERTLNPSDPVAHLNVGAALGLLGRHREAIPHYRRVLELSPEHVQAHLNLAFSLLALGEFAEGWRHHEWRHAMVDSQLPPWPLLQRSGLGRPPGGQRLLVHSEQGYGDTIQFIRFIPHLADLGYCVTVTCQPELATLVGSVRGVSRVVPHGESLPVCDLQVLLLSLPYLFGTTLETLPDEVPYLAPRPHQVVLWHNRLCGSSEAGGDQP